MSWTISGATNRAWATGGVSVKPANATAVKLNNLTATSSDDGRVLLQWRSGYEVNNLGYHLYREQGGERVRLTPELVAGSALFAGVGTPLTAGRGYTWWDAPPRGSGPFQYWLEDVDLNGTRTWHGPVEPVWSGSLSPERSQAVLLSRLGSGNLAPGSSGSSGPGIVASPVPPGPPGPGSGNGDSRLEEQWALASQPAAKLSVRQEGWYRVTGSELSAAGFDPGGGPGSLRLFAEGEEQPILIVGGQDGRFDPSDSVEFYGLGADTPWSDARTYWLVRGSGAGQRIRTSRGARAMAGPASFPFTVERKDRTIYFAALTNNGERENFFGSVISSQ
ncbi:MAG: hypothetical protein ACREMO_09100, partial [Gemmatimonadales bacterium]